MKAKLCCREAAETCNEHRGQCHSPAPAGPIPAGLVHIKWKSHPPTLCSPSPTPKKVPIWLYTFQGSSLYFNLPGYLLQFCHKNKKKKPKKHKLVKTLEYVRLGGSTRKPRCSRSSIPREGMPAACPPLPPCTGKSENPAGTAIQAPP